MDSRAGCFSRRFACRALAAVCEMSGVDLYYEMCAAAARVRAIHLRHLEALGAPLTAIAALGTRQHVFGIERARLRTDGLFEPDPDGVSAIVQPVMVADREPGDLLADADWLFENYAMRAATACFSTLDLFGVLSGRDGWGGIACRLHGSRSLVMSGEVARWRRVVNGEPESFARGLGDTVQMVPLWECG